jgi:Domain of unknown function (DUF4399)
MQLKSLWYIGLLACCLAAPAVAGPPRTPSAAGASIAFANLADGDVVPPGYVAQFTISGMGIAPAGSQIDNTGHFHLLIDLAELPPLDQPLPATEQIVHFGKGQTETPLNLPEGQHRLQLLLADYAHVPHDPPVLSEAITIVVASDAQ